MDEEEPRRRGWFGRILGLAAIVGAGALWRQRQQQRDLDEDLWGDPQDLPREPREPRQPSEPEQPAATASDEGSDDHG